MRMFYIGFEFTHDKTFPAAVVGRKSTRVGPVKRWVDACPPRMLGGKLRERVGLILPAGFRFSKDQTKQYLSQFNTYADAKFYTAMSQALGKYLPYDKLSSGHADEDGDLTGDADAAADPVPRVKDESKSVEGSAATG